MLKSFKDYKIRAEKERATEAQLSENLIDNTEIAQAVGKEILMAPMVELIDLVHKRHQDGQKLENRTDVSEKPVTKTPVRND